MNWEEFSGVNWALLIDWLSNNIHDSTESLWSNWNHNWGSGISDGLSSDKTLSGIQSDGTDVVATQMLGDFENESVGSAFDLEGIENRRKFTLKFDVDDGTDNLGNFSSGGREATYT